MRKRIFRVDRLLVRQREQDRRTLGVILTPKPRSFRYRLVDAWKGLKHWMFGVGV